MITPQELRYGNKLLFLNEIVTFKNIAEFRDDGVFWINFNEKITPQKNFQFNYVQLTEESLFKLGFTEYEDVTVGRWYNIPKNKNFKLLLIDDYYTIEYLGIPLRQSNKIKYVHQLQNLYSVLTGEELKIKE